MPRVGLYTLGCKVSQYETEAIAEGFEACGFTVMPFDAVCDAYVINTCTVTAESDRKSRQIIRRAASVNGQAVIAVVGCYSQTSPEEIARIGGVDIILGSADKMSVIGLVQARLQEKSTDTPYIGVTPIEGAPFEPMCIRRAPRTRAYIKIEDGCECRCTYCEIPNARGHVRSKPPADVIAEAEALAAAGTQEIVLTGIETASYGVDFLERYRLIDLLEELDRRGSCRRIRLGSLSPEVMTPDFLSRVARLPSSVPHFHLSMQSGSDGVLRSMKRRYNRTMALDALRRAREAIPRVQFTTDLMVGFPGEGDAEFEETLDFVRRARFLHAHVFAYSRRPGTPAADYADQVEDAVKHRRSAILIAEIKKIQNEILDTLVAEGNPMSVVLETEKDGVYHAHADTFVSVRVKVPEYGNCLHGQIIDVIPTGHSEGVLLAKPAGTPFEKQ